MTCSKVELPRKPLIVLARFTFLFIIVSLTYKLDAQQPSVILGRFNTSSYDAVRIMKYSPYKVENRPALFSVEDQRFEIKMNNQHPEAVRIFNDYFLLSPGDTLNLKIEGIKPDIEVFGFNRDFIKKQQDYGEFGGMFWKNYQYFFDAKEYIKRIDQLLKKTLSDLDSTSYLSDRIEEKQIVRNHFVCQSLFLLSLPFVSDTISPSQKIQIAEYLFPKLVYFNGESYLTRNEYFDIAVSNLYKGLFREYKSFSALTNSTYWKTSDTLKEIIASRIIEAYANNKIILTEIDLPILKNALCIGAEPNDDYCNFYTSKVEYGNLFVDEVAKNDFLISSNDSTISCSKFFSGKNTYAYFWASWCAPCIEFIKKLDMRKLEHSDFSSIVFISIDENKASWMKKNEALGIPNAMSYLMKNGLKSGLPQALKIDRIPFFISISKNKINKLNVTKEVFADVMKQ